MHPTGDKRRTEPPPRLTYTRSGQQVEVKENQGLTANYSKAAAPPAAEVPKPDGNLYLKKSPAEIQALIEESCRIISTAKKSLEETEDIASEFRDKQEDDVGVDAWQNWVSILNQRQSAQRIMQSNYSDLVTYKQALQYVERQNERQQTSSGVNSKVPPEQVSKSRGSSHSSSSLKLKQIELDKKKKERAVTDKYEDECNQLRDQIDDIDYKIQQSTSEEEAVKLKRQKGYLEGQIARKQRDFEKETKRLLRDAELEKEEAELELEEEQFLDPEYEPNPESITIGNDNQIVNNGADEREEVNFWRPHQQPSQTNVMESSLRNNYANTINNEVFGYNAQRTNYQRELPVPTNPQFRNSYFEAPQYNQQEVFFRRPRQQHHPPNSDDGAINNLAGALKKAFSELKGEREWDPRDLPVFTGKAEDWPIFINEFRRTTPHGKTNSSQNAIRLRKALKGSAREAVIGLLNDPENVSKVLSDLEKSFGRNELVIRALVEKAEQTKSPEYSKPETFIPFGRTVRHLVETVRSLKEDGYIHDRGLLEKLMAKLPGPYRIEWLCWIKGDLTRRQTLYSFGEWVDMRLGMAVELVPPVVKDEEVAKASGKGRFTRGSATVNVATTEKPPDEESKNMEACRYCEKIGHALRNCFKFKRCPVKERNEIVKKSGCCFRCLGHGHLMKDCPSEKLCGKDDCPAKHHPLLHSAPNSWKKAEKPTTSEKHNLDGANLYDSDMNIGAVQSLSSKPLSVVRVRVIGPKGTRRVFAMLDSGADTTVIQNELAKELGITGPKVTKQCRGIGGNKVTISGEVVDFGVAGIFKKAKKYSIAEAVTMPYLGLSPYSQNVKQVKSTWPYLKSAKLESFEKVIPQLIIGEDHPYVTAHRTILQGEEHQPMAKRTLLGWVIAGKKIRSEGDSNINALTFEEGRHLDDLLQKNFSLDSFGVYPKSTVGSVEDRRALQILEDTVVKSENKWECGLLWRDKDVKMQDSRPEAVARLIANERRMKRDTVYADMYHAKIHEYLSKEYIHELSPEDEKTTSDRVLYIPHFGVYNINKPGKLRLVFDAACKNGGTSLNQHLLTGPDLIRSLATVLMNFRRHNIALNGDIEDMFHRVSMRKEDRDSQRFLFRNIKNGDKEIRTYTMDVLIFGACSSPSSAIYVKNRNAEDFASQYPEAARVIKEDFYVDDCLTGAQTVDDTIRLRKEISSINASGNFVVKKWLSNSKEVLSSIPENERCAGVKYFGEKTELPTERVLGMWYSPEEDAFTFTANFKKINPAILEGRRPTKREMCGLVMSVFDPLGFVANFKVKGLMLLQMTWRTEVDWDEEITDTVYQHWLLWLSNLKNIENIKIPRCYQYDIHLSNNIQLHTLVDSSEEACCAICFLRMQYGQAVQVSFVRAKTKVAPTKKLTIPRLELIAAVMGACLADDILEELKIPINSRLFWSDSRTVLMWIKSESLRYKEFVANRVNRIHLLSNVKEWRWIPTLVNVADEGTRLCSKVDFSPESRWLNGPLFLQKDQSEWPMEDKKKDEIDEAAVAEAKYMNVCTAAIMTPAFGKYAHLVPEDRFSDFMRLCRAQAAVMKITRHWLRKVKKQDYWEAPFKIKSGTLPKRKEAEDPLLYANRMKKFLKENLISEVSPPVLEKAEAMLLKKAQGDSFEDDIDSILDGKLRSNSKLRGLSPFMENGLLKVRGRIQNADVPREAKYPIILPARHRITELIILKEHERCGHQGQATVLGILRQKYWIMEARAAIRRAFERCQSCRLWNAKPVFPKMGNLPYYRLSHGQPPFTFTGVDLFGPLEVVVGRHREKRWVCVFTCMVTRAIHLEVVYGLSTDETMMAISRFMDIRGKPRHVYSDNGTNFVGAKKELWKNWQAFDWTRVVNADKFREINWHFNPPRSPHFGGAWERMVQAVKRILKKTLIEIHPKDQTLMTMLRGAENLINSRPLTYISSDPNDPEPLTPNHFLRGFSDLGPNIPGEYEPADEILRAQWRKAQYFMDIFWRRWVKEVLPELTRREKWHDDAEPLGVGDIVLMVDDQCPRNTWKKAVVISAFPGDDGQVRVVEVETSDYDARKKTMYRRGVDKIVPLGIRMGKSGNPA